MCVNNCGSCSSCLDTLITIPTGPQGPSGSTGAAGPAGSQGDPGPQGQIGMFGGYSGIWDFSASILGAPAAGELQISQLDWSTANRIYVRHLDANGEDLEDFLDSFNNDGHYGHIRLSKEDDSSVFITARVTSVVNSGTFNTIYITNFSGNGLSGTDVLTGDKVILSFAASGATGVDSEVVEQDFTTTSSTSTSFSLLKAITIPAGLLAVDDVFVIEGQFGVSGSSALGRFRANLNADAILFTDSAYIKAGNAISFKIELHVFSLTQIAATYRLTYSNGLLKVYDEDIQMGPFSMTPLDLSSNANTVNLFGQVNPLNPGTVAITRFTTYKFKK